MNRHQHARARNSKEILLEESQEASKTSVKLIAKLNDSLETANEDLQTQEEANVILKDQNILLASRFRDVEELVTKAQEDVKKRDKVITDLKKTQKYNENRIRENLEKTQEKNAMDQTQIKILKDDLSLTRPTDTTQYQTCRYYMAGDMVTSVTIGTHKRHKVYTLGHHVTMNQMKPPLNVGVW